MLLTGFISTVVGCKLPGPGAIYVKQEPTFLAPAPIDDTITAKVTVTEVDVEKNRVIVANNLRQSKRRGGAGRAGPAQPPKDLVY